MATILTSFRIAGNKYHHKPADGTARFELEPENEYDKNAIRIMQQHGLVGYVPKKINQTIAQHFDSITAIDVKGSKVIIELKVDNPSLARIIDMELNQ